MSEEKYTIDMIEEESIVGDWLIANENMLDSDNPQDVKDFNNMRDYYRDLEGYYATPKGFISTAIPAAGGDRAGRLRVIDSVQWHRCSQGDPPGARPAWWNFEVHEKTAAALCSRRAGRRAGTDSACDGIRS